MKVFAATSTNPVRSVVFAAEDQYDARGQAWVRGRREWARLCCDDLGLRGLDEVPPERMTRLGWILDRDLECGWSIWYAPMQSARLCASGCDAPALDDAEVCQGCRDRVLERVRNFTASNEARQDAEP